MLYIQQRSLLGKREQVVRPRSSRGWEVTGLDEVDTYWLPIASRRIAFR